MSQPKEIEEIVKLYKEGLSLKEIGKIYHHSDATIKKMLIEVNVYVDKRAISEDDKQKIIYDYLHGISVHLLKSKYHRSDEKLKKILIEAGVYKGRNYAKKVLEQTDSHSEIIEKYLEGKSLSQIGKTYHLHSKMVKKILKDHKIEIRPTEVQSRKYFVNSDFFSQPTHDMWYIIGFVAADGNIAKYSNSLDITLAEKDSEILEKISKTMEFTGNVKHFVPKSGHPQCRLTITDKKIVKDLEQYNIVKAKTFIYRMPEIPDNFLGDYLRGYLDGDGWVSSDGKSCSIITASEGFMRDLLSTYNKLGLTYSLYTDERKEHIVYDIRILNESSLTKFKNLIYNNIDENSLFLERKKSRFFQTL